MRISLLHLYFSIMKKKPYFRFRKEWTPFEVEGSSQILEVAYDSSNEDLYIRFIRGGVYKYHPVKAMRFEGLRSSNSVGAYFHKYIKKDKSLIYAQL